MYQWRVICQYNGVARNFDGTLERWESRCFFVEAATEEQALVAAQELIAQLYHEGDQAVVIGVEK